MNSYLFEKIGQTRRESLIDDAAADRFVREAARASRTAERAHDGFVASLRRFFAGPDATEAGFLPRLADYPVART